MLAHYDEAVINGEFDTFGGLINDVQGPKIRYADLVKQQPDRGPGGTVEEKQEFLAQP